MNFRFLTGSLVLFTTAAVGFALLGCAEEASSGAQDSQQIGGATNTAAGGSTSTGTSSGGSTTSTTTSASASGGSTASPSSTGGASTSTGGSTSTASTTKFSFFVTSYKAIQALSGSAQGFGGDLRYGTSDGLTGADKICADTAERAMAGNGKTWKAYLSTSTVNAIDRIGAGPWYDRLGRVVATTTANLLATRPIGADTAIINDLPNEDGVPNHAPDGTQVDNHDTLTGTNHLGTLYSATAHCTNWTSSAKSTSQKPRVGHTWPRSGGGMGGGQTGSGTNAAGMAHWASALDESGCGAGVNLIETGAPGNDGVVGSGGGYGGFYCFALTP